MLALLYQRHGGLLQIDTFCTAVNQHTPEAARVLLVNTDLAFHCARECVADSFFEASQVRTFLLAGTTTAEDTRATLSARGITHIVHALPAPGQVDPVGLKALLQDPSLAQVLASDPHGAWTLYEIAR